MLGRQLPPGTGRHADHQRHAELAAGHVPDRGRVVHDLVEGEQREIDRHDLDDRPHAAHRRADARAGEGGLGQRRVADAFGPELVQKPLGNGVAAAVMADILAHQEDAAVALHGFADRFPDRLAVGRLGGHDAMPPPAP